jgi:hypothetical protein
MPAEVNPKKEQAKLEAAERTQWEHQRILSYKKLRYDYSSYSPEDYYRGIFERDCLQYRPAKDVSKGEARKSLHIGLAERIKAQLNPAQKAEIDERIKAEMKRLQVQIDTINQHKREQCNNFNERLRAKIDSKKKAFLNGSPLEVRNYYTFVIEGDNYSVDGVHRYETQFSVKHHRADKRLVIDYQFPAFEDIPKIKEWAVNKNNEIVAKQFSQKDMLEIYEGIIMDLTVRVLGLVFDSDNHDVISEAIFNGYCEYSEVQSPPTFILSVLVQKKQFDFTKVNRADFSSKHEIAKFESVKYLGDIRTESPTKELLERPPLRPILPIQSNIYL